MAIPDEFHNKGKSIKAKFLEFITHVTKIFSILWERKKTKNIIKNLTFYIKKNVLTRSSSNFISCLACVAPWSSSTYSLKY